MAVPDDAGLYDRRNVLGWRAPFSASGVDLPASLRGYLADELGAILSDENGEPFRDGDVT